MADIIQLSMNALSSLLSFALLAAGTASFSSCAGSPPPNSISPADKATLQAPPSARPKLRLEPTTVDDFAFAMVEQRLGWVHDQYSIGRTIEPLRPLPDTVDTVTVTRPDEDDQHRMRIRILGRLPYRHAATAGFKATGLSGL